MLELKDRQIAAVKRQYRNSLPAIKKIESLNTKIEELIKERDLQQAFLDGGEAGIRALTGGYASYELIKCEYIPQFNEDGSPKMDKEGKYQVKKQVLTFVQPNEKTSDTMTEEFEAISKGCFPNHNIRGTVPEVGNDFDLDSERLFNELENEVAQMEAEKDYQNELGGIDTSNDNTSTEA